MTREDENEIFTFDFFSLSRQSKKLSRSFFVGMKKSWEVEIYSYLFPILKLWEFVKQSPNSKRQRGDVAYDYWCSINLRG